MSSDQRIFLQTVWSAIEDAGYGGNELYGSNTGVYVGYASDAPYDYKRYIELFEKEYMSMAVTGNLSSILASRISHILDLKGISLTIDTACSSSLIALHQACQAIKHGEIEQAIIGSIKINYMPLKGQLNFGVSSSDGKTKTFNNNSDGTGSGEGSIALILKSLNKAIKDKDAIYAVIKGSAVNQDGKSMGISAPNVLAQESVIQSAWKNANIDPCSISYIEAHGTGTRLGDSIEIEAITKAFSKYTNKKMFCGIGSIKTNFGHLDNASGMTGILKAILSLKTKKLFPNIHFTMPNKNIFFEESPIYVVDQLADWNTDGASRRCGVSTFGFSGTNCHVILEEFIDKVQENHELNKPNLFLLSAKSLEALEELIDNYKDFLDDNNKIDLSSICYTLVKGRWHYEYRLAIVVENLEELTEKLANIKNYSDEELIFNDIFLSTKKDIFNKIQIDDKFNGKEKYAQKLRNYGIKYINGKDISLSGIFYSNKKVNLPSYPFQNKRSWVNTLKLYERLSKEYYYKISWVNKNDDIKSSIGSILFFSDCSNKSNEILKYLSYRNDSITVIEYGNNREKENNSNYLLLDNFKENYEFLKDIEVHKFQNIVFTSFISKADTVEDLNENIEKALISFYRIIKNNICKRIENKSHITIVANEANKITGRESVVVPENNALFNMGKAIIWEYPHIKIKCLDIDNVTSEEELVKEIGYDNGEYLIAYRENQRYVEKFEHATIEVKENPVKIKNDGAYIITGGLGGFGLEFTKWLVSCNSNAKIVLINRSHFPDKKEWSYLLDNTQDIELIKKIHTLRELENMGSEITLLSADITDYEKMKDQFSRIKSCYKKINGVIHCAGISKADNTEKSFRDIIEPKITGTFIVDKLVEDENIDFFLMCSSAITLIGGVGSGAYTAANAYIDAFVDLGNNSKKIAVNWPTLKNTGLAKDLKVIEKKELFHSISSNLAIALVEQVLMKDIRRVAIGEFNHSSKLIELGNLIPLTFSDDLMKKSLLNKSNTEKKEKIKSINVRLLGKEIMDYTDIELKVTDIWREVLGFEEFDVNDKFMEIGGDSIMLVKVHQLLNETFGNKLSMSDLFAYHTIAEISNYIKALQTDKKEVRKNKKQDIIELIEEMKKGNISLEDAIENYNSLEDSNE